VTSYEQYAEYIKQKEYEAANKLLKNTDTDCGVDKLGDFVKSAYYRVADMFQHDDFRHCRQVAMVGCGPFPMTALHIIDQYPNIHIDAMDIDLLAIRTAQQVVDRFSLSNHISLHHHNGIAHDYQATDIVYIANLVRPKHKVLDRIHATCRPNTLVILRDPTEIGKRYAESGLTTLRPEFTVEYVGNGDNTFHSRHVFLRCHSAS
jgi:Nicotianamine synthase protein